MSQQVIGYGPDDRSIVRSSDMTSSSIHSSGYRE